MSKKYFFLSDSFEKPLDKHHRGVSPPKLDEEKQQELRQALNAVGMTLHRLDPLLLEYQRRYSPFLGIKWSDKKRRLRPTIVPEGAIVLSNDWETGEWYESTDTGFMAPESLWEAYQAKRAELQELSDQISECPRRRYE